MINESAINEILVSHGFPESFIVAEQFIAGQEGYMHGAYEGLAARQFLRLSFVVEPAVSLIQISNEPAGTELYEYLEMPEGPALSLHSNGRSPEETFQALMNLAERLGFFNLDVNT